MSDLANAAEAVLNHLDAIDVDALVERLEALTLECDAHRTAVDQDWDAFWTAAVALVGRVEAAAATVTEAGNEAGQAVEGILPAANGATAELDPPCTAAYEALDRLGGRAGLFRATLDGWLPEQVLGPGQALVDEMGTLGTALKEVVRSMTAAFENEVLAQVDEHANGIRWYQGASTKLARAATALVTTLLEEWAGRLAGVVDVVEREGFDRAFGHLNEATAVALEESAPEREAAVAAAMEPVEEAAAGLAELASDAASHAVNLAATGREVAQAVDGLMAALRTSSGAMNATTKLLAERGLRS